MAQRYYPIAASGTAPTGCPTASQSAAFPAAQDNDGASAVQYSQMGTAKVGGGVAWGSASGNYNSLASTTQQSCWVGYAYLRVAAQTFGAGTWQGVMVLEESNNAANMKQAVSIYVYRVGTGVVGYIYDSLTQLGNEASLGSALYRAYSVTGSNVTAQNGDYLIVEFHGIGTQSMGTSYVWSGPLGLADSATADAAEGDASASFSTWLDAPAAITEYSPANEADGSSAGSATVSGVSGASARSDGTATGTGTGTGVAAAFALSTAAAIGAGVATGDSVAVFAAVASAAGIASVVGESEFVAPPIFPLHPRRRELGVLLLR